jgi:hypothetical protein
MKMSLLLHDWFSGRKIAVRPMSISFRFVLCCLVATLFCSCASQPLPTAYDPPGFFSALVHGLVAPLALVGSIVFDIRIYAFPNTGFFYDLGYILGLMGAPFALASLD